MLNAQFTDLLFICLYLKSMHCVWLVSMCVYIYGFTCVCVCMCVLYNSQLNIADIFNPSLAKADVSISRLCVCVCVHVHFVANSS